MSPAPKTSPESVAPVTFDAFALAILPSLLQGQPQLAVSNDAAYGVNLGLFGRVWVVWSTYQAMCREVAAHPGASPEEIQIALDVYNKALGQQEQANRRAAEAKKREVAEGQVREQAEALLAEARRRASVPDRVGAQA